LLPGPHNDISKVMGLKMSGR